jgi:serine/threonine-protein kinase
MPLSPGSRIGPYEIVSALGAGAMGEVYRARDTRLSRDVAVKVLPAEFATDHERVARFEREAQILASLNHPHIATIYGLEEQEGSRFLVMELVEGETLHARLANGPLSVAEAVIVARQIADALQVAHDKGIVHRDLKPANVAFTEAGFVKVLDFGLAKGFGAAERTPPTSPGGTTLSSAPVATTQAGIIMGTVSYMAPEQARGMVADKRCDIWAFGCVLYEMLTGRRAFEARTVADTLALVLKSEPDWTLLPASTAPPLRALLKGCLEKDRQTRIADIAAATFVLSDPVALLAGTGSEDRPAAPPPWWWHAGLTAALAVAVAAAAAWGTWLAIRPAPPRVTWTTVAPVREAAPGISGIDRDIAITPDGSRIVYVGNGGTQLFVRPFAAPGSMPIATGVQLRGVFVSPDGQWVGFVENNILKRVAISGGPTSVITALRAGTLRGAAWLADDTIVFATTANQSGLERVPAAGGDSVVLTEPDRERGEADHMWPEALPGGRSVLFTITAGSLDAAQIAVLDVQTREQKVLVRGGTHAQYAPSGHIVYTTGGTLRAAAFDVGRLELQSVPVTVLPRLVTTTAGAGDFAIGDDGTLVYIDTQDTEIAGTRSLVWVDRQGVEEAIGAPARAYVYPRLSPDGTRIAVYLEEQDNDIWLWDLSRATLTRVTFEPGNDQQPVWTPDGRRLVFGSVRAGGAQNIFWQAADGSGTAERLTQASVPQLPTSMSPDGRLVMFYQLNPETGRDLMRLALGDRRVETLLQTRFEERNAEVSPDGRWLAYESDTSGRFEIYVRPFPNVDGGQWPISAGGGTRPAWSPDGRELFYLALDARMMRVSVTAAGSTWSASNPEAQLAARYFTAGGTARTYDISRDGRRFLLIKQAGSDRSGVPPQIVVVQNWTEELARLAPRD